MKTKLKGFTLLEMMIVLVLFSLVMFSCVRLLDPVTKFFVRSSNFESTTACADNMKRCIEGNLKYADRVRAYAYYKPYDGTYTDTPAPSTVLKSHVESFYNDFFEGRATMDSAGYIYVLVFDNTVAQADISSYTAISDYTDAKLNTGKMILYKYWFNNYDPSYDTAGEVLATVPSDGTNPVISYVADPANPSVNRDSTNGLRYLTGESIGWLPDSVTSGITDWYVNQKLYGNYDYHFTLENLSNADTVYEDIEVEDPTNPGTMITIHQAVFNPADFAITISMKELRRVDGNLIREETSGKIVSAFAMANVLDASVSYTKSSIDYKLIPSANELTASPNSVIYTPTNVNRYQPMVLNDNAVYDGTRELWVNKAELESLLLGGGDTNAATQMDYFYFIFTLPETTYTNPNYFTAKQIS